MTGTDELDRLAKIQEQLNTTVATLASSIAIALINEIAIYNPERAAELRRLIDPQDNDKP